MDNDLASLPDDLLDVRQDLSQYSYDPTDPLDVCNQQHLLEVQYFSSQQSSQQSEKLTEFLPFGDASVEDDEDADLFDDNLSFVANTSGEMTVVTIPAESGCFLPTYNDEVVNNIIFATEVKHEPDAEQKTGAVPIGCQFHSNAIAFDVNAELLDTLCSSTAGCSPDSTDAIVFEDNLEENLSINDDELLMLSTRELNRRIRQLSADEQRKLKSRRRTLKNRGYAQTCRTRRVGQRNELELDNQQLKSRVQQLDADNRKLNAECERLRRESVDMVGVEIAELRAKNQLLVSECERLRQEGARCREERDYYKARLDAQALIDYIDLNAGDINFDESV